MTALEQALTVAFQRFQAGDYRASEAGIAPFGRLYPHDPRIAAMLGQLAAATGRHEEAVFHLRTAVRAAPRNVTLRTKLCFALLALERYGDARDVAAGDVALPLRRVLPFVDQREGRSEAAILGYRAILEELPGDYEGWCNLGLLLSEREDPLGAEEAFRRAVALAPSWAEPAIHLSRLLRAYGRRAERRDLLSEALRALPSDPALLTELGEAELAVGAHVEAERAFVAALATQAAPRSAWLEYGMLLERLNRLDDMATHIASFRRDAGNTAESDFLEAWLMMRRGENDRALRLASAINPKTSPIRHAQLVAQAADRIGDHDRAFAAFSEMNRLTASEITSRQAWATDFMAELVAAAATVASVAAAPEIGADRSGARDPIFLLGFPRSGTTLLDTLLMNLPHLGVLEEVPILERLWDELASPDRVAGLTSADISRMRKRYVEEASATLGDGPAVCRRTLDKFPLNLVRVPLLHRLFPNAPIIFAERHPCDVVLSCFMARFENNRATVHFHSIDDAARLYDRAMTVWTTAVERLPLRVHTVRYERLVDDAECEMRALLNFLGETWRSEVVDNEGSAARRAHIATASYAQVGRPISSAAVGRWRRYRPYMASALPILGPWAERLGYAL